MSTTAASIEELRASAAAAVEAANAATAALIAASGLVTQQSSQQQVQQIRTRKPDLPEFDSRNVEIWLKRVQSAYDRAGISLPKDKFAFLESKFAVGSNPSIDAFLYGPATEEAWNAFVSYLKNEYGRTVRQEAQYIRGQFSRDGRKPSQMLAQMKEKVKRVTIDDILKEIILSSLPGNVQQMVTERVKDLTADQTAAVADNYFDQSGRPLHSHMPQVQHVDAPQQENVHNGDDDSADINAIKGRRSNFHPPHRNNNKSNINNNNNNRFTKPFQNNGFSGNNNKSNRSLHNPRSSFNGAQSSTPHNTSSTANASAAAAPLKSVVLCANHQRYGDKTYNCQPGCSRWPEMPKYQSGNANAGNRR